MPVCMSVCLCACVCMAEEVCAGRMIPGSVAAPVGLEGRRLQGAIKKQRRILVLGYEGGRKLLSAAKTVMVDGTFKSAPRNFTQVSEGLGMGGCSCDPSISWRAQGD